MLYSIDEFLKIVFHAIICSFPNLLVSLELWADQEFYEEHPVMWLLTPEQDYKVILCSGYTTAANSEAYTIFSDSGKELEEYLEKCIGKSDFEADVSDRIQEEGTGNIADKLLLSRFTQILSRIYYLTLLLPPLSHRH